MESKKLNLVLLKNQSILKNIAFKFTKDPEEINELVQETLVRSIKYIDNFFNNPKLVSWLYVIMKNVYINHYRRHQRHTEYEHFQSAGYKDSGCSEPYTNNTVNGKFIMSDIQDALKMLPPDYYELFVLYIEGYKYRELAEYFGIPEGTVKTRIHHTRKFLQKKLSIYREQ